MINSGEVIGYSIVILTLISLFIEFYDVFFGEEKRHGEEVEYEQVEEKFVNPNVQAEEIDI